MDDSEIPRNPPPPYTKNPTGADAGRLSANIPAQARRSMEDEMRPLPQGWIRQWDPSNEHQFFVDTKAEPPRSIWHHPHDDDDYLSTLTSEERERLQEEESRRNRRHDLSAEGTDEEPDSPISPVTPNKPSNTQANTASAGAGAATASSSAGPSHSPEINRQGKQSFGRKMKDKITGTTHDQRVAERAQRAEQEQQIYEMHMAVRRAMTRAMQTGQPQFVCKDKQGHDVYVEPPRYGGSFGNPNYRGYNPYAEGPYTDPNARFIRPAGPYQRPYGGGYGGGLGLPLAGGLAGGLLLGGLLGGF